MTRSPQPIVGLIANPVASKDIRRLVGLGRVVDVEEKANLIARLLVGMTAGPSLTVHALDDSGGVARRAVKLARGTAPPVEFLPIHPSGTEQDTFDAAIQLRQLGAAALVTVGGDGTIRSAVQAWPDVCLVPLAAGTNNAVVMSHEPTMVGYATARAAGGAAAHAYDRLTSLQVDTGGNTLSVAVVDVVGVRTRWTGARALWEPDELVDAVVANVRPGAVGIASVAAALGPLPHRHARVIRFGRGKTMRAVFGPGLVGDISVSATELLPEGSSVELDPASRVVALDGERRLIRQGKGRVSIAPGPHLLSVARALST